ncbi:MAG: RnfABCDGE type electron transport complex subunit G [candidate division KSB1 bacterium]|nr:RnfABCDGE type electron transport complex subunit G [candidate division KSB1 bacterium]
MSEMIKLGGLLMVITAIAATALAGVYSVAKPRIDEQKAMAVEQALNTALPNTDAESVESGNSNNDLSYYMAFDSDSAKKPKAYAYIAKGAGYSSMIETMVGVDTTGTIVGMKVLSQTETPGLGTRIEEVKYGEEKPWFQQQFIGLDADSVALEQNGGSIQAITGATISSQAVTRSVTEGYEQLLQQRRQ